MVRSAASSGDDVKDSAHRRVAATYCASSEGHPGERHALLGVGRKFITLDDCRKPCFQSHQIPGARSEIAGAQIGVRWRRAWVDAGQGIERLLIIARLNEGTSQEKVRCGETGVEADGLAEFSDRVVDATGRLQGVRERLVGDRGSGESAHRLTLFLNRCGPIATVGIGKADLVADHPVVRL